MPFGLGPPLAMLSSNVRPYTPLTLSTRFNITSADEAVVWGVGAPFH
ncbi:unnamed protein product, partial [marine sediment metagenome]